MAHTYAIQLVHCVFSTKGRCSLIPDPPRMWAYVRAIGHNLNVDIPAIGGTNNHLHILLKVPSTERTADIVRKLKCNSSRWMNEIGSGFGWQDGYAAISVSPSQGSAVVHYIENQREHHREFNFEQEYETLLRKSGVAFDPNELF